MPSQRSRRRGGGAGDAAGNIHRNGARTRRRRPRKSQCDRALVGVRDRRRLDARGKPDDRRRRCFVGEQANGPEDGADGEHEPEHRDRQADQGRSGRRGRAREQPLDDTGRRRPRLDVGEPRLERGEERGKARTREALAQPFETARDALVRAGLGDAAELGDLAVGARLGEAQHERDAQLARQRGDVIPEHASLVVLLERAHLDLSSTRSDQSTLTHRSRLPFSPAPRAALLVQGKTHGPRRQHGTRAGPGLGSGSSRRPSRTRRKSSWQTSSASASVSTTRRAAR